MLMAVCLFCCFVTQLIGVVGLFHPFLKCQPINTVKKTFSPAKKMY